MRTPTAVEPTTEIAEPTTEIAEPTTEIAEKPICTDMHYYPLSTTRLATAIDALTRL